MARRRKKAKTTGYTKNRNRIMAYVRRYRRKGVIIDIDLKTEAQLRSEGIRGSKLGALTKSLKKIKPKQLKELIIAEFDPETGEIYGSTSNEPNYHPTTNYNEDEDFYERVVISNWYGTLYSFEGGVGVDMLKAWADQIRRDNGDKAFVEMISTGMEKGVMLTWETVYHLEKMREYIAEMMDFIPDQGVLYKDQLMDKFQFMSELTDYFETTEEWEI